MRRPSLSTFSPRRLLSRRSAVARRMGLRARITLAFAIGALLLSALLSATTWALTRENLVNQREDSAMVLVFQNARTVQSRVKNPDTDQQTLLSSLSTPRGARPILYYGGKYVPLTPEYGQDALPPALRDIVISTGQPARMRYKLRGQMQLAVGVPLPAVNAAYFEIISLDDVASTLEALAVSLIGASLVTTLAGAALGWWAARRALRPLAGVSTAALALAAGRLDTRLDPSEDRDLRPIAASFNNMAQALQDRIEQDGRFASDVSHELRSPLMTLAASDRGAWRTSARTCPNGPGPRSTSWRPTSTGSRCSWRTCSRSPASTPAWPASSSRRSTSPSW